MESTTLYSSLLLPLPFSRQPQKTGFLGLRKVKGKVFTSGGEPFQWDYAGKLVDESMIVLRKGVHEMKVIERNYEPPADWTEWEKQYYLCYDELVCNFVGLLQRQLMNTRPSFGSWDCLALNDERSGVGCHHLSALSGGSYWRLLHHRCSA